MSKPSLIAGWFFSAIAILCLASTTSACQDDITWDFNGDGYWSLGTNWNPNAPAVGDNIFIDDGDSAVTAFLDVNASIGNLTIGSDDTLSFNNTRDLTVGGGTINNAGLILMNSTGGLTDLTITANTLMTGGGTLRLSDSINNRIFGSGASVLTVDNGFTIEGSGQLGVNFIGLVNNGLIDATGTNPLTINPADVDLNGSGADVLNNGILQASGGGTLQLFGGDFVNSGGTIQLWRVQPWLLDPARLFAVVL